MRDYPLLVINNAFFLERVQRTYEINAMEFDMRLRSIIKTNMKQCFNSP